MAASAPFACPPDCGACCSRLERSLSSEEVDAAAEFRRAMREVGVYSCADGLATGLSLSNDEADELRAQADARGLRIELHPRTFLLETRLRLVVALDWHLAHDACPFHHDFRCTVYEQRPLVCRAFPVVVGAPRWTLAPLCPETERTLAARSGGLLRLGSHLRGESAARRQLDAQHARLDDVTMRLLDAPRLRFAAGLAPEEAAARAARYRLVRPEALRQEA